MASKKDNSNREVEVAASVTVAGGPWLLVENDSLAKKNLTVAKLVELAPPPGKPMNLRPSPAAAGSGPKGGKA